MENRYELYHYGVKGQKWGVRRYQNEDGTLTRAGQRRYNKDSKVFRKAYDKARAEGLSEKDSRWAATSETMKGTKAERIGEGTGMTIGVLGSIGAGLGLYSGLMFTPIGAAVTAGCLAAGLGSMAITGSAAVKREEASEAVVEKILKEYGGTSTEYLEYKKVNDAVPIPR